MSRYASGCGVQRRAAVRAVSVSLDPQPFLQGTIGDRNWDTESIRDSHVCELLELARGANTPNTDT